MALIYGLADTQSFYASCEVALRPEYAAKRTQWDDFSDPALVVAGDPERRSGIILAATPAAKAKGITNAMRLGEALRLSPSLVVVRPRMRGHLDVSVRIQHLMREMFPLQEQFSVDEGFFAFPYPADLFSDPLALAREFQNRVWEQFRIRCRVELAPNKWLAKMANGRAKKVKGGVFWWREEDVPTVSTISPCSKCGDSRSERRSCMTNFAARRSATCSPFPSVGSASASACGAMSSMTGVAASIIRPSTRSRTTHPTKITRIVRRCREIS